jgi:hypothetical protein
MIGPSRFRPGIWVLVVVFGAVQLWARPAAAGLVTTEQVVAADAAERSRDRVRAFMMRDDVRTWIEALGIDPREAEARVDALTDEEIARINARLDELPAGGDFLEVVAVILLLIILILLVTDLIGYTDVFPFIRPLPGPTQR